MIMANVNKMENNKKDFSMKHRHINADIKKSLSLEAIDDIISRGDMPEWLELRNYALRHSEILDDIIRICSHYIIDPYEQKYHFWYNLALYLKSKEI